MFGRFAIYFAMLIVGLGIGGLVAWRMTGTVDRSAGEGPGPWRSQAGERDAEEIRVAAAASGAEHVEDAHHAGGGGRQGQIPLLGRRPRDRVAQGDRELALCAYNAGHVCFKKMRYSYVKRVMNVYYTIKSK